MVRGSAGLRDHRHPLAAISVTSVRSRFTVKADRIIAAVRAAAAAVTSDIDATLR